MMDPTTAQERRWWNQLRCGDAEAGARAGFALSALLCDRGRDEEAEMILMDCARSSSDAIAAAGALRLAQLIERSRGHSAAELIYEQAAARATPAASADVLIDLAERWDAHGETERARQAYEASASESPQPSLRAVAFFRLGGLDSDLGRMDEAVTAWENGLADAAGSLRIHFLVRLAEALLDLPVIDRQRVESLLGEAIDSDHPDLAPRAALRLAQMKRANGQFIDAYRLAHLVADSEHPVFAAEGEGECQRLLHGELDSLLALEAPNPQQLELPAEVNGIHSEVNLYLPIAPCDVPPQQEDIWSGIHHALPFLNQARLWSPRLAPRDEDPAAGSAFWSALVINFNRGQWSVLRSSDEPRQSHALGGSSLVDREVDLPGHWNRSREALRCSQRDLEFLLLLRATGWLRSELLMPGPCIPWPRLHLVFERTTKRLADLLAADRQPHCHPGALCITDLLGVKENGTCDYPAAAPSSILFNSSCHTAAIEAPVIEKAVAIGN